MFHPKMKFYRPPPPYTDTLAIMEALSLAYDHKISDFAWGELNKIHNNLEDPLAWEHQQIIFQLWPIKMKNESKNRLVFKSEELFKKIPPQCTVIAKKTEVLLVRCE